ARVYQGHLDGFLKHLGRQARMPATDLKPFHVIEWVDSHETWGDTYRRGAIVAVQRGVRPADRVLDGHVVIPPEAGHHHGPWKSTGRAEGTAVAAPDRTVAGERAERAGLLCPARSGAGQLLRLAACPGSPRG